MAKRKIPTNMQPWTANINGEEYEYQSGTTAEVPDEVAALIDFIDESAPKRDPKAAQRAIEDEVTQIVKDNFAGGVGYEETSETVMLPETSFEVAESSGAFVGPIGSFPYVFEVGRDYTVTLDGEPKTYTAIDYNETAALTNTSLDDIVAGNGWLIQELDGQLQFVTLDPSLVGTTHTISINKVANIVRKIDRKFIEDMPLYIKNGALSASDNGAALDPALLAELLETKHCYIYDPSVAGNPKYRGILSCQVYHKNNVVVAVACYFINPSSGGAIESTQNGTPPIG